jgi:hypothetical protein
MKNKYYGYYLKDNRSGDCLSFDIRGFLVNFTNVKSSTYKSSFSHLGEHLYLFHSVGNVFIFVETRSPDFFKQINTEELVLSDLRNMIDGRSELGYASYVVFAEDHFGICSTYMAPGIPTFCSFINDIFTSLGVVHLEFVVRPLTQDVKISDVMRLNVVGRTSIELPRDNRFAQDVCNVFGADISNDLNLDSVEIIFKPRKMGNIKPIVSRVIDETKNLPDATMKVRAKDLVKDTLTDFYLGENGLIYDEINYKREADIPGLIVSSITSNKYIAGRVNGLKTDVNIKDCVDHALSRFNSESAWCAFLDDLSFPVKA